MIPNAIRIASRIDAKSTLIRSPSYSLARSASFHSCSVAEFKRLRNFSDFNMAPLCLFVLNCVLDYSHINASSCVNFCLFVHGDSCLSATIVSSNWTDKCAYRLPVLLCIKPDEKIWYMIYVRACFFYCGEKIFLNLRHHRYFCFVHKWHRAYPFSHMPPLVVVHCLFKWIEISTTLNNLQKNVNGWFDIHSSCIGWMIAKMCVQRNCNAK